MKCDDCLDLLEAYADGEATEREAEHVRMHLTTCANCEGQFEALAAENEMYARYDRELSISPALWNGIAARLDAERQSTVTRGFDIRAWFAGLFAAPAFRFAMPAMAMVLIALFVGLAYWRTRPQVQSPVLVAGKQPPSATPSAASSNLNPPVTTSSPEIYTAAKVDKPKSQLLATKLNGPSPTQRADAGSDVLFKDAVYEDVDARDTASHLEQAQNLLVSFRNIQFSDTDDEVDVAYEKAESRRLLNENVVLRREAESNGKYPAKAMLGSLEPFLIDIANLPDKAKPADVRQITDRVQRTEIVAELRGY